MWLSQQLSSIPAKYLCITVTPQADYQLQIDYTPLYELLSPGLAGM